MEDTREEKIYKDHWYIFAEEKCKPQNVFYSCHLSHHSLTLGTGRFLTHHMPWIQVFLYNNIMIVYVLKININSRCITIVKITKINGSNTPGILDNYTFFFQLCLSRYLRKLWAKKFHKEYRFLIWSSPEQNCSAECPESLILQCCPTDEDSDSHRSAATGIRPSKRRTSSISLGPFINVVALGSSLPHIMCQCWVQLLVTLSFNCFLC